MSEGPSTRPARVGRLPPGRGLGERKGPAPTLLRLLETLAETRWRVLVPGHTAGLDALAWAGAGHEVVGADASPRLLQVCAQRGRTVGMRIQVVRMDPLEPLGELDGEFDAIWERSCFCALEASQRECYVRAMARLLKPGGLLYGLFTDRGRPHDVTEACVRSYFHREFAVERMERPSSPTDQLFVVLRRKDWHPGRWGFGR